MEETKPSHLLQPLFDRAKAAAYCRAIESEQANAHFRDPYARLLAGERGKEIVRALPGGKGKIWPVVLRTCIYDELIMRFVEQEESDTVIYLGAGLDTRPYRLALPSSLRWIEADSPDMFAYKADILADAKPTCQLEHVSLDITDAAARKAFLSQVGSEASKALVLTEGLLSYLTESQVSDLAKDLHSHRTLRWWIAEFIAPRMLESNGQAWDNFAPENMRSHFAPSAGGAFFQPLGWKVAEFRPMITEGLRLNMPIRHKWLLRLLGRLSSAKAGEDPYNVGAFVLLENNSPQSLPKARRYQKR